MDYIGDVILASAFERMEYERHFLLHLWRDTVVIDQDFVVLDNEILRSRAPICVTNSMCLLFDSGDELKCFTIE
jgi:hypothetical protein